MLKAVIFDMDGVLIDSEPIHFEADVNLLKQYGIEDYTFEIYKPYIGSTAYNIWDSIKERYSLENSVEELLQLSEIEKQKIIDKSGYRELKGVVKLVNNIFENKYPLALASSSPYDYIIKAMTAIGLRPLFHTIVSGASISRPKPAPDIFLQAAKELGVRPEECLVIEDSQKGVEAAKAAGMICVGLINPHSGDQDLSKADYLLEGFEDIDYQFFDMVYCHTRNEPWKVLETENLIIREISLDDLDSLYKIYADGDITRFIENLYDRDEEIEFTEAYIKNMYAFYGYGLWVVLLKETGQLIGRIGLSNREVNGKTEVELGYVVGVPYQKKGYAYEACSAIIGFAKNKLGLDKLNIFTVKENIPSVNLARKLGFKKSADVMINGKEHLYFELLL